MSVIAIAKTLLARASFPLSLHTENRALLMPPCFISFISRLFVQNEDRLIEIASASYAWHHKYSRRRSARRLQVHCGLAHALNFFFEKVCQRTACIALLQPRCVHAIDSACPFRPASRQHPPRKKPTATRPMLDTGMLCWQREWGRADFCFRGAQHLTRAGRERFSLFSAPCVILLTEADRWETLEIINSNQGRFAALWAQRPILSQQPM